MNVEGYKECWVRITDWMALSRCANLGLASVRIPVIKIRDSGHGDRLIVIGSVFREVIVSHDCFLLRGHVETLSFAESIHLDIKDQSKKLGLCVDCLVSETLQMLKAASHDSVFRGLSVGTDDKYVDMGRFYIGVDLSNGSDMIFSSIFHSLNSNVKIIKDRWSDHVCGLKNNLAFAEEKQMLPDEIDLYNFFGKLGGRVYCVPDSPLSDYDKTFCVYSIPELEEVKNKCERIEYYISEKRYYAIRFKNGGVFLVSEKRYNELKQKKGK